jgi:hypothetical protein
MTEGLSKIARSSIRCILADPNENLKCNCMRAAAERDRTLPYREVLLVMNA